jgi:hypothetical protein
MKVLLFDGHVLEVLGVCTTCLAKNDEFPHRAKIRGKNVSAIGTGRNLLESRGSVSSRRPLEVRRIYWLVQNTVWYCFNRNTNRCRYDVCKISECGRPLIKCTHAGTDLLVISFRFHYFCLFLFFFKSINQSHSDSSE